MGPAVTTTDPAMRAHFLLQRRGERRVTINKEMGGVYDVNVLYGGMFS